MCTLHLQKTNDLDKDGNPIYRYAKPTPWVWSGEDFQLLLDILKNVQAPSNYEASLAYKIRDKKMGGFKMHD